MRKSRLLVGLFAVLAGLMVLPSMASALNFQPGTGASQAQVGQPSDVATGDFNGDGLDDLAVASGTSSKNGLNVALATGGGAFDSGTNLDCNTPGTGCFTVVAGQFTGGDSDLDLFAVPFQSNSQVISFVGNGTGVFVRTSDNAPTTPYNRESTAVGDLNGNGVDDIVYGAFGGSYVIGIAQGPGTFSYSTGSIPGAGNIRSATMGDFNGDGDLDVAMGDESNHIFVLLGDGGGSLTLSSQSPVSLTGGSFYVEKMVSTDFNGDGNADIAVTGQVGNSGPSSTFQTFLGDDTDDLVVNPASSGSAFSDSTTSPGSTYNFRNVTVADFDADGVADDVEFLQNLNTNGPQDGHQASVRLSNGDGTFTTAPNSPFSYGLPSTAHSTFAQSTGDFNGDGAPDLVLADSGGGGCSGCSAPVLMNLADVSTDPTSINFGGVVVGDDGGPTTLNIKNGGAPTAHLSGFTITGTNANQFSISDMTNCNATIASTCTKGITFTPTSPGDKTATLNISNADGPNLTVALTGTGTYREVSIDPTSFDFGEVATGTTSDPYTFLVTSAGTAPIEIGDVAIGAGDSGSFSVPPADDNCSQQTIAPGDTCTFDVVMNPVLAYGLGAKSAVVNVPNNDPDMGHQTISVSGTSINPGISVSPSPYAFADAIVGGTGQGNTFTVASNGDSDLTVGSISFTGADASDFSIGPNNCTSPVTTGSTCTFVAIFHPGASNHAVRQATMSINSNAASSPTYVTVTGTALVASATATPEDVDYGDVKIGQTTAATTLTFKATGTAPVEVDEVGLNGPDSSNYSRVSNNCDSTTVPAGGTCQVAVNFTPSERGELHGEVKFATDAGNFYVELTGTGIDPAATLTPANQDFGSITVGSSSAAKPITLKSTGQDPLKVTSASITGTDAGSFALANAAACNGTQAATCDLNVTFSPTGSAGARSATLSVVTNAGTITSTLTGTAAAVPVVTPKASLTLKAPKSVRKGKTAVVTTKVKGLSAGAIAGIVVAAKVSGPGKAPKSVKISSLGQGKTKTVKLKIPVKKSAKPGKKLTVTVTAKAGGKSLASKKVKVKIKK